jgi:hypothetical protein
MRDRFPLWQAWYGSGLVDVGAAGPDLGNPKFSRNLMAFPQSTSA